MKSLRLDLKVCEGCGALWLRAAGMQHRLLRGLCAADGRISSPAREPCGRKQTGTQGEATGCAGARREADVWQEAHDERGPCDSAGMVWAMRGTASRWQRGREEGTRTADDC